MTNADQVPASDIDDDIGTPLQKPSEEERRQLGPVWTEAQLRDDRAGSHLRRLESARSSDGITPS